MVQKAANQNHARAQYCLGWHYSKGIGIRKDDDEAFKWYKKAAEQGHAESQYWVAFAYEIGTDFGSSLPKIKKKHCIGIKSGGTRSCRCGYLPCRTPHE